MKTVRNVMLALVTAPDLETARALAKAVLEARQAACANLVPKIESHYWWQGKLESSAEVLMVFKTTRAQLAGLEQTILANHPYDTPEFIAFPLTCGNARYLDWIGGSMKERFLTTN